MPPAKAKHVVASVLEYFTAYMQFARMRNDYRTVQHFEDCWVLVFTQFFGSYSTPLPSPTCSYREPADAKPATRPPWFTEKYGRPVRKVIGQITERVAGSGRTPYFSVTFDVLECGHKLDAVNAITGAPPAKHRRCGKCVKPLEEKWERTPMQSRRCAASC